MKKLIIVNCVLALAVIFTYCSKPELTQDQASLTPEIKAENRATCTLTNLGSYTNKVRICGTNLNSNQCISCLPNVTPNVLTGIFQSPVNGDFAINLTTPIVISISAPFGPQTLWLNAGGNQLPLITLAAGECRSFSIDDNCNITAL